MRLCPKCGSNRTATERRPNGNTKCLNCRHEAATLEWDRAPGWPHTRIRELEAKLREAERKNRELQALWDRACKVAAEHCPPTPLGMLHVIDDIILMASRLAKLEELAASLIGGDEYGGLCRCCGRAHAIGHDRDCPVPAMLTKPRERRRDELKTAALPVLQMAEQWHQDRFDVVCDHEPGDCQCDAEARSMSLLDALRAALTLVVALAFMGCGPLPGDDIPFGVGPHVGCEQVHQLVDAYVLAEDPAPADWQPTTMNPDCGQVPLSIPQVCDVIGPRESFNGPGTECYVHIDFDCEGQGTEAWWYTVAAGLDGIVVGAADCGWQVFF